ncbi:MAG TPA: GAF domain-containing protein, partial [Roseiflexaceae bacterium]|nr:GAF domain-containing protein [Roseiflexaceae bacterium]
MTSLLSRWLADQRDNILPQWIAVAESALHKRNGHATTASNDEQAVLLTSVYNGLIEAAHGDSRPLEQCLKLLRALRTEESEDTLVERIAQIFHLRRIADDVLHSQSVEADLSTTLCHELDSLVDETVLHVTRYWTTAANAVTQQLQQTELLIANLNAANDETDRLIFQVSKLNDIASMLASRLDAEHSFAVVSETLVEVLNVAYLSIWLPDGTDTLRLNYSWGEPPLPQNMQLRVGSPDDVIARAFTNRTEIVERTPDADMQGPWYQPACGVLAVPLLTQEQVHGVVVLQDPDPDARFNASQRYFVSSAVSQMAMALQNTRLYNEVRSFNAVLEERIAERTRELQAERDVLETMNQIALEASSTLDLDMLLQSSLQVLADIVHVERGSVLLVDVETDQLTSRAVLGRQSSGFTRFAIGQGIAGWVAQHKKPALVHDVNQDPRWVDLPDGEHERKRNGSMISVPLIVQHDVMGVLQLSHDEPLFFNDEHLRLLIAAAGQIALGIHNALLYEQIQQQLMRQGDMLRNERRATTQSTAILQSLSDGVIVCDPEGIVITANPVVERILDLPLEDLVILNMNELFVRLFGTHSKTIPFADLVAHPLDNDGQPRSFTMKAQVGTRVVRLTVDPVLITANDIMGTVAVLRDITRETESERLKDEFIGTVSHELRTPMTSIKGYTQLLAMGSLGAINDTQREFLNTITTNAERMISIINDLLDITKIETGAVELNPQPIHLAEAL